MISEAGFRQAKARALPTVAEGLVGTEGAAASAASTTPLPVSSPPVDLYRGSAGEWLAR